MRVTNVGVEERASESSRVSAVPGGWLAPLDGLRGISILMVITAHVYRPGWPGLGGALGVTIFFVLSGFLITRLLLREEKDRGTIDMGGFYIRRAFRLFPLYYAVLALYCVLLLGLHARPDLRASFLAALPFYVLYLQEIPFFPKPGWIPFFQSWSLGIEEKFYFVWPLLAFKLLSTSRARIAASATLFGLFSAMRWVPLGQYVFPYAAICMGCLVALFDDRQPFHDRMNRLLRGPVAWVSVALLVALQATITREWPLASEAATVLYPIGAGAVLMASLASPTLGGLLSSRPLVELGRLSYGIYLIHLLVRNLVETVLHRIPGHLGTSGVAIYLLTAAGSVVAARVLSARLETPMRLLGRRIAAARVASPEASLAAAPPRAI
jgi:peptidoglycan/LPS O-acetylase OafA/YrhL